jgi:hypothetical protein
LNTIRQSEIDDWVAAARSDEVVIDYGTDATKVFLTVFAKLLGRFELPDYPCASNFDWRAALGFEAKLAAVWDLDYYRVSLRIERVDDIDCAVLAKHEAPAP